jgi:hypothetical protein
MDRITMHSWKTPRRHSHFGCDDTFLADRLAAGVAQQQG